MSLLRTFPLLSALGLALLTSPAPADGADKAGHHHPRLHHALHELREARTELKEAKHDFGGHKARALTDVDVAITQVEKALLAAGDNHPFKGTGKKDHYKKYAHHPHIHHAVHELKEARDELKETKHDFGGHRDKTILAVDAAIDQLHKALASARKK